MSAPQKILVIVGQTASGKSALGVELARRFGGEIVSADSRQVYRGLDIGTGKVMADEMQGVPHHLLDVTDPQETFTAHDFVQVGRRAIADIASRGHLPIIVGGTGFYIDALLGRLGLSQAPRDTALRSELADLSTDELLVRLEATDPDRAARMNESDRKNPVRLIRALEVAASPVVGESPAPSYDMLWLGMQWPSDQLAARIEQRLDDRIAHGMIDEARSLHEQGLSWERMEELGLEYGWEARHLRGDISRGDMRAGLLRDIIQYAKRQATWWKRNTNIRWLAPGDDATPLVDNWLAATKDAAEI